MNSIFSFFYIFPFCGFFLSPLLRDPLVSREGGRRSPRLSSPTWRRIRISYSGARAGGQIPGPERRRSAGRRAADVALTRRSSLDSSQQAVSPLFESPRKPRVTESRVEPQSLARDLREVTLRDARATGGVIHSVRPFCARRRSRVFRKLDLKSN